MTTQQAPAGRSVDVATVVAAVVAAWSLVAPIALLILIGVEPRSADPAGRDEGTDYRFIGQTLAGLALLIAIVGSAVGWTCAPRSRSVILIVSAVVGLPLVLLAGRSTAVFV